MQFSHPAPADFSSAGGQHLTLLEVYNMFFEVVPATTPDLREAAHRLRYQVYCVENCFERPENNPGGLEIDEYDTRSVHSVLIHRATRRIAGTVRLILPAAGGLQSLPAVRRSAALDGLGRRILPEESTLEISRFSISKDFRRRIEDGQWPAVTEHDRDRLPSGMNRRVLPNLTLGLMRAIVQMSIERNATHWCAIVETPLLRLLKRLGIQFRPAGSLVEYHGWRQPVFSSIAELLDGIYLERPEVWSVITDNGALWPAPGEEKAPLAAG